MTLQIAVTPGSSLIKLSLLGVWIFMNLEMTVARGEVCEFEESKYDPFTSSYRKRLVNQECKWGCCSEYRNTACCGPPIALIVGCVLGGTLMLGLFVVALCCCCVCRRDNSQRYDPSPHPTAVIFQTSTSGNIEEGTMDSDPPPSYEEVMRGELNRGFKPDS